ncbi:hypothetical protein OROHE_004452 [Orobanche hederae]
MVHPYPNVWRREKEERFVADYYVLENTFHGKFDIYHFNESVAADVKDSACRVSDSCSNVDGIFMSTILTSSSLLRRNIVENCFPDRLKGRGYTGNSFIGRVVGFDWHLNVAAIEIRSIDPFPVVKMKSLDDMSQSGNPFIAVGRYHSDDYELMVAPGTFSISPCEGLDCNDLLRVNCKITKCGIGGPMINLNGEVVGINFYSENFTPFLPINVVTNWWNQAKGGRSGHFRWNTGGIFFIELKQHQLHQEVKPELTLIYYYFPTAHFALRTE